MHASRRATQARPFHIVVAHGTMPMRGSQIYIITHACELRSHSQVQYGTWISGGRGSLLVASPSRPVSIRYTTLHKEWAIYKPIGGRWQPICVCVCATNWALFGLLHRTTFLSLPLPVPPINRYILISWDTKLLQHTHTHTPHTHWNKPHQN